MWVVKGKTTAGKDVEYKVPAGKDTDKAFVLALAFQQHGATDAEDPLTAETTVTWTSDNVVPVPAFVLASRVNYAVDRQVDKGEWVRHAVRAFRSMEAATEVLESAASEYPSEKFRIVRTETTSAVVAQSKNVLGSPETHSATSAEDLTEMSPQLTQEASTTKPKRAPKAA
jgi:hypothetical protein